MGISSTLFTKVTRGSRGKAFAKSMSGKEADGLFKIDFGRESTYLYVLLAALLFLIFDVL